MTAPSPSDKDEQGWMVERTIDGRPAWWTGGHSDHFDHDPNQGVRFCRHQDAFWVARHRVKAPYTITEHSWIGGTRTPLPETGTPSIYLCSQLREAGQGDAADRIEQLERELTAARRTAAYWHAELIEANKELHNLKENTKGVLAAWKRDYDGERARGDAWMADCKKAEAELASVRSATQRIEPERVAEAIKVKKHEWENADPELLEPWYSHWVQQLTEQGLHSKADIATVLAILSQHAEDSAHDSLRLHRDKMALIDEKIAARSTSGER